MKTKNLLFLSAVLVVCLVGLINNVNAVTVTDIFGYSNPFTTSNQSIMLGWNISTDYIQNLTLGWDNQNFSLYDPSLILMYNFDNRSSLGENDTVVKDLSMYGNNGTVVGGSNISWTPNGKYGGAFNFSGNVSYIKPLNQSWLNFSGSNLTIGFWFKTNLFSATQGLVMKMDSGGFNGYGFRTIANHIVFMGGNGTSDFSFSSAKTLSSSDNGQWIYVVGSFDGINKNLYINGVFDSNKTYPYNISTNTNTFNIGRYSDLNIQLLNGSIDNLMIWNRTLSQSEITQLYNSSLTKYSSQNWTFTTTELLGSQTLNSTNSTPINFNYFMCSSNLTTQVCTSNKVITKSISSSNLGVNFSNSVGIIRDDFYGTNFGTKDWFYGLKVNGGVDDSNTTWHKQTFQNSGMKTIRFDMNLNGNYYWGLVNKDLEQWDINSFVYTAYNSSTLAPYGWQSAGTSGFSLNVSKSTDAYQGTYSANLNNSGTQNSILASNYFSLPYDAQGHLFTFTIRVKSSNGILFFIGKDSDISGTKKWCSSYSTGDGLWDLVNCSFTADGNLSNNALIIDIPAGQSALIDDIHFYEDGVESGGFATASLLPQIEEVKYAHDNGYKILFVADYTPYWLADNSSGKCTYLPFCPPNNYTYWNSIVLDYLNRVTSNGLYNSSVEVEVWNEPYNAFWMGGLADDNINKANNYTLFYNSTYHAIKNTYPTIDVGGPSGYRLAPVMTSTFLSNASTIGYSWDFLSIHPYGYNEVNSLEQYVDTTNLIASCVTYGVNCSKIILSEYSIGNNKLKSNNSLSNELGMSWGLTYQSLLNNYPANVTSIQYSYGETTNFTTGTKYQMVQEPIIYGGNGELTSVYNTTKSFATYCPAGSTVYQSSSDDSTIKTVTCKKGNRYNIIIINSDTNSKNVTLNNLPSGINNLTDINGNVYQVISNSVNLGIMDSYQEGGNNNIMYLTQDLQPPAITISSPLNQTYSTNSINFNLNLDEEGSWCGYSLDGSSNVSMNKQGVVTQFDLTSSIPNGNHNVVFTCNDTSNNYNSTNVSFVVNYQSGGSGGNNNPTCNPLWICNAWSGCSNNLRNRQCVDIDYCNSNQNPPLLLSCSLPLPSDRITGCVDFPNLDKLIYGWKLNVYDFETINEAIYKWKGNVGC